MTKAELRTQAASFCQDPNLTKFTSAKYDDALEQAQRQFGMDSKALYKDSAIVMIEGQAAYSLPTDFTLEKEVTLNGLKLEPISRATLQAKKTSERWDDDRGTPKYFIIDPEEARKTISLYPIPDNTGDGTALVLTYYFVPAVMDTDATLPFNGSALMTQFHIAVSAYAAWLLMMNLTPTAEISQKRNDLFGVYNAKIAEAIQTFGNSRSEPMRFHVEDVRVR